MSARFEVDSSKLNEALKKFQGTSKKSSEAILRQQGKLLVVELAGITPPNKKFKWNKKGGETTVKNDLAKLFRSSKASKATSSLAQVHLGAKDRRGRVPKGVEKVPAMGLVAYRKLMLGRVGRMAAGWKSAANKLNAKLPAWITRHDSAGHGKVVVNDRTVEVELTNKAVYSGQKNWLDRAVKAALKKRYWAMIKQVTNFERKAAKQAGFATT
jgi:hypothetical protein